MSFYCKTGEEYAWLCTEKNKKKDRPKYVLTEQEKENLYKGDSSLKMTGRVLVDINKIWKGNVNFGNLGVLRKW